MNNSSGTVLGRKYWFIRVLSYSEGHRLLLLVCIFGAFLSVSIQASQPALLGYAIDSISGADPWNLSPWTYGIVMISLALIRMFLFVVYIWGLLRVVYDLELNMRSNFLNHVMTLPFAYFDRSKTGTLVSKANTDIAMIIAFIAIAPFILITMLGFVIAIAYMMSVDLVLTLMAVASLPAIYVVGRKFGGLMSPLTWFNQFKLAELADIVDENIKGAHVVRTFAAEEAHSRLFSRSAFRLKWLGSRMVNTVAQYSPIMENLPKLSVAAIFFYGGISVINNEIGLGTLVAFNLYMAQLLAPISLLSIFLVMERRASASAQRVFGVLDENPNQTTNTCTAALPDTAGTIEFRNVSLKYENGTPGVSDISLKILPGEKIALVGGTGSGKTTLMGLLVGFYEADGVIKICGKDIKEVQPENLHDHVCIVSDDAFLFSSSIFANIAFGRPSAEMTDVVRAAKAAQAHEFIVNLPSGYHSEIGENGVTLSGGERQRIALARALLLRPPVLILDDATKSIDVVNEAAIYKGIQKIIPRSTLIFISHRLPIIKMADRVMVLSNGALVSFGRHQELFENTSEYRKHLEELRAQEQEVESMSMDIPDDSHKVNAL